MKRVKQFLITHIQFFLFFILISVLLYFFVLGKSGYIFYGDLSGGFSFNRTFYQYFFIDSPYDGIEIALKSRMPVVSVIWGIWKFGNLVFSWDGTVVIKIALTLMFLGTYSSFYFSAPRLTKLLIGREISSTDLKLHSLLAFIYSVLPVFIARTEQLEFFIFPLFYPLFVWGTLKLIKSQKVDLKSIFILSIILFFGMTSPHSIVFYGLTALFLIFPELILIFNKKKGNFALIKNLSIFVLLLIINNVYWILPYFIVHTPEPGYVVNTFMISLLNQNLTLENFIFGTSEWYLDQTYIFSTAFGAIQLYAIASIYAFAFIGLLKLNKKRLVLSIIIFMLIILLSISGFSPIYMYISQVFVYGPLGWVFREITRLGLIWWFWVFLLSYFGIFCTLDKVKEYGLLVKIIPNIFVFTGIIFSLLYSYSYLKDEVRYLEPTSIVSEYQDIVKYLENDDSYYYYYWMDNDVVKIPWVHKKRGISDYTSVRSLLYNISKPSLQNSSVLPYGKSEQQIVVNTLISYKKWSLIPKYLRNQGVKYIVIDKSSSIMGDNSFLITEFSRTASIVVDNKYYLLFEINNYDQSFAIEKCESQLIVNTLLELEKALDTNLNVPIKLVDNLNLDMNNITYYTFSDSKIDSMRLNLIDEQEYNRSVYFPYDLVRAYGLNTDWGRASSKDRINGELHQVLNHYGLEDFAQSRGDKVIYSDINLIKDTTPTPLEFRINNMCPREKCEIWVNVLKNTKGGTLIIGIDDTKVLIDTRTEVGSYFEWVKITDIINGSTDLQVSILNKDGFNAVGGIIQFDELISSSRDRLIQVDNDSRIFCENNLPNATWLPPNIIQFSENFLVDNIDIKNRVLDYQIEDDKIILTSNLERGMWLLFIISYIEMIAMIIYILLEKRDEKIT